MVQLLSYKPRTLLELVKPENYKRVSFSKSINNIGNGLYEDFGVGDLLYYKSHFKDHINWIPCKVICKKSRYIYEISIYDNHRLVHVSKLRKRREQVNNFPLIKVSPPVLTKGKKVDLGFEEVQLRRSERLKMKQLELNN